MNDIVVVFLLFILAEIKVKKHASCLLTNIAVDTVPWQRGFYEKLRESCILLSVEFSQYLA